jgi:hypothetical protein
MGAVTYEGVDFWLEGVESSNPPSWAVNIAVFDEEGLVSGHKTIGFVQGALRPDHRDEDRALLFAEASQVHAKHRAEEFMSPIRDAVERGKIARQAEHGAMEDMEHRERLIRELLEEYNDHLPVQFAVRLRLILEGRA